MNGKESIIGIVNLRIAAAGLVISRRRRAVFSLAACRHIWWAVLLMGRFNSLFAATTVDSSFNPNVNGEVRASAIQSDGKVLIGGPFTTVGGVAQSSLARLNSDGSRDQSWGVTINGVGWVEAIYIQPDGNILIGGNFTNVSGSTRKGFARLTDTGSGYTLDTTFGDAGLNNGVLAIGVHSFEGEYRPIVAGLFSNSGHSKIARLTPNGIDGTFAGDIQGGSVNALAVGPENSTYLGGNFSTVTGTSRNNAAWVDSDGYVIGGPEFTANPDGYVSAIATAESTKTLLGGYFTTIHGSYARDNAAKVDNYGIPESSVGNPGPNGMVQEIKVDSNNKYLIGGSFSSIGSTSRTNIARLNSDGTVDTDFTGVTMPGGYSVQTISLFANGNILVGGNFTNINGVTRNRVAKLVN